MTDTTVAFPGARSIVEGNTGLVEVAYLGTITQNFMITVESYQCTDGDDAATRMYYYDYFMLLYDV